MPSSAATATPSRPVFRLSDGWSQAVRSRRARYTLPQVRLPTALPTFQDFLALSWGQLLVGYLLLISTVAVIFASLYVALCRSCQQDAAANNRCDASGSFLFATVSILSNGGYTGEASPMLSPGTGCFPWRALLIHLAWISGTFVTATGTSVIVGKWRRYTALGDRVHISQNAVVWRMMTEAPPRVLEPTLPSSPATPARLHIIQFRVANSHPRPIVNAKVSLTAVKIQHRGPDDAAGIELQTLRIVGSENRGHSMFDDGHHHHHAGGAAAATAFGEEGPCKPAGADVLGAQLQEATQSTRAVSSCHMWYPITITHWLEDPSSPVSRLIAAEGGLSEAMANGLQFVLQVTGRDPLNGANIVVRKAFTSENTKWNHRFATTGKGLVCAAPGTHRLLVNIGNLNATEPVVDDDESIGCTPFPPAARSFD